MLTVKFQIDGREITPQSARDELEAAFLRSLDECIRSRLKGVRCDEHDKAPLITVHGADLKCLGFEITGCCYKLKDAVLLALSTTKRGA